MRRQFATLAVAALLLVAGCAALGGGGGDPTGPNDRPGDGPTADPVYETPLADAEVVDAHREALRDAGTFTLRTNNSYGQESARRTVIRGDLETDAMYASVRTGDTPLQVYRFGNGTGYRRSVSNGETTYGNVSDIDGPSSWTDGGVQTVLELYDLEYEGATTEDGETVHVYEAEGPSSMNRSSEWFGSGDATVEAANATLRIRGDGLVVRSQYAYTVTRGGDTNSVSVTRTFTNLGDTDLTPPAWIPAARNATA